MPTQKTPSDTLREQIAHKPNEPRNLHRIDEMLRSKERHAGMRHLFDLYAHPALNGRTKGAALWVLVDALRGDADLFDPRAVGLEPEGPAFTQIYRGLKHHLDQAIEQMNLIGRFQHGTMTLANSPKFIIAIPKSGSSLLGLCLGNMVKLGAGGRLDDDAFAYRGYPAWWKMDRTHDWDLRPEIGADRLFATYPGGV